MIAKHWRVRRVGLGAQAGMPVLLNGKGAIKSNGAGRRSAVRKANATEKEPARCRRYKGEGKAEAGRGRVKY